MRELLRIRSAAGRLYGAGEFYIQAAGRFALTFICLFLLVQVYDYIPFPGMTAVILLVSLLAIVFPWSFSLLAVSVFAAADLFFMQAGAGLAGGVLFLTAACLYLGFLTGGAGVVLLSGLCSAIGLPGPAMICVMLFRRRGDAARLLVGMFSGISLRLLFAQGGTGTSMEAVMADAMQALKSVLTNPALWGLLIVAALGCLAVYLTGSIPVPAAPVLAAAAGITAFLLLEGLLLAALGIGSVPAVLIRALLSCVTAIPAGLLLMVPVAGPARYLQFEDDDYIYYVKAIPRLRQTSAPVGREAAEEPHRDENE